jgi:5-(aminomethyl)-3-furanmethanol phosphate kinase
MSAGAPLARVRVVKLGGSLLEWPPLARQLRAWLAAQPPASNVLVVGGGAMVEALRAWDRAHHLPDAAAHWLAVRAMRLSASVVAELLPEARRLEALCEWRAAPPGALAILDAERFLREDSKRPNPLPETWDVTSDSIAARVATVVAASELALLKSALPTGGASRQSWADAGFVDAYFPQASAALPVRCVNLRADSFPEIAIR